MRLTYSHAYSYENKQKQPPECSVKKGIPKNFSNFTGKHL